MYKYCCCCCCYLCCGAVLVSQRGKAEGVEEADGDPPRELVERRKREQPRGREIEEISKLGDKPRSQQQQQPVHGTNYYRREDGSRKSRTLLSRRKILDVSPSPQVPAKRAQFRVALLGGGARSQGCARGDRPGGGRGTGPVTRAREKWRSRARDRRPTDPKLRTKR